MQMTFVVAAENGHFRASVFGASEESATGPTKDLAVAALRSRLLNRFSAGELVSVDIEPLGILAFANSKYRDDPDWQSYWDEVKAHIQRERDEEHAREFPE